MLCNRLNLPNPIVVAASTILEQLFAHHDFPQDC